MKRQEILEKISSDNNFDVLIIGGGINGAASFLDLAINNAKVLLVDRGDFCSGASSTSSHMAHGGIRYLENGEFRLVREAVTERNRMIQNYPHMVKPLPTIIPMFKFWSGLLNAPLKFINLLDRPSERGAFIIKLGLMLYDSYTGKNRTVPKHSFFGKKETFERFPHLNKAVKYSAMYYDGQIFSPERLNTELILEAETLSTEAIALNYVSLIGKRDASILLEDSESGKTLEVRPKVIINAAGPWIDIVNDKLGLKTKYIGGTKGSHIIVNNPTLREAIGENEFFFENKDGRIVLLFPFFDKVIIGTSDLPIDNPDSAICSKEEEVYFIELVKRVFPEIKVTPDQIIFRFSGVRPLEFQNAKTTGQITRDHSTKIDKLENIKVFSLVGGKLTSFRAFGEQTSTIVLQELGLERKNNTETLRVGGGKEYPSKNGKNNSIEELIQTLSQTSKLDANGVRKLFFRYGMLVTAVIEEGGNSLEEIKGMPGVLQGEIIYFAKKEKAVHLDDILLRRTSIGWLGLVNNDNLREVAEIAGKALGWSKTKQENEITRTKEIFREKHGVVI